MPPLVFTEYTLKKSFMHQFQMAIIIIKEGKSARVGCAFIKIKNSNLFHFE